MAAPHQRDFVFQGESFQRCVGLTVLQHHAEVALLVRRLRIRQSPPGHLRVLFLILHLHATVEALRSRVVTELHRVVVHARHREIPLHLLVIRKVTGIVCRDEVCAGDTSW